MSQKKPDELNQTSQASTGAPATDTHIASSSTQAQKTTDATQTTANSDIPNSNNTIADTTENPADSNQTPMPTKEPITDTTGWSPKKKSYLNLAFLIVLIVIGVALILYAWKLPPFTPTTQQTNNAFLKGQTTIISPQVSGYVTQVAEKRPISNIATCGIYWYRRGSDFVKYAKQMIDKEIRVNNEFYIAPVYNELISDGKTLVPFYVHEMWGIGTPEDLKHFLENKN